MKNKFLTLVAVTSLLVGCSDAYEIEQPGIVTQEAAIFNNSSDIKKGVQGLYSSLPGESEVQFSSVFTDELGIGVSNGGQGINDGSYTFVLQAGNDFAGSIWGSYYGVVNRTNRILNRIDELVAINTSLLPTQKDGEISTEIAALKAQKANLLVIRAYCHYKLFAYFTPDYTNPSGLSVIKFDFLQTDNYSRYEKRATVAEIVAFIEKDINDMKALGGITDEKSSSAAYVNNAMAEAILIKLYAMVGTDDAYAKLEQAFNRMSTGDAAKSLGGVYDYAGMYNDGSAVEHNEGIFRLKRVSTDGTRSDGIASQWFSTTVGLATGNIIYFEMGRSLYNEFDKLDPAKTGQARVNNDRDDVRYNMNVTPDSKVAINYATLDQDTYMKNDVLLIGKYTGITNRPLMNDIWIFRYTDMLLSLAEKRAFEGNTTGTVAIGNFSNVESIIYNIRANRNFTGAQTPVSMPTNFSSKQQAYARILEERRLDFAFEGARYLDMKRLGVKAGSPGFVRHAQDCASTNACSLEPNTFKATLPIPRSEILSNPNIIQNPGY